MKEKDFYISENNEIRRLFTEKYQENYEMDGVIAPDVMFSNGGRVHVVMLLKEGFHNQDGEDAWCPVKDLENNYKYYPHPSNTSGSFMPCVCRTVKYATEGIWWDKVPMGDYERPNGEYFVNGFAHINVRKSVGSTRSDDDILDKYAKDDSALLKRQIISCHPDVVFCCENNDKQIQRLETIFGAKAEIIANSLYAYRIHYDYQGKKNSLIAIKWVHPSQYNIPNSELKNRLVELKDIIKQTNMSNQH